MAKTITSLSAEVDALEARLVTKEEEVVSLKGEMETLRKQFADLVTRLDTNPGTITTPIPRDPTVPDPIRFAGDPEALDTFLFGLTNVFRTKPNTYRTDAQQVGYGVLLLEGRAAEWGEGHFKRNPRAEGDYKGFVTALKDNFEDPSRPDRHRRILMDLTQGTRDFAPYILEFQSLMGHAGLDDTTLVAQLIRGLNPELQRALFQTRYDPTDLPGTIRQIRILANGLESTRPGRQHFCLTCQSWGAHRTHECRNGGGNGGGYGGGNRGGNRGVNNGGNRSGGGNVGNQAGNV
jgi:uncharacterized membrane protein YgcG